MCPSAPLFMVQRSAGRLTKPPQIADRTERSLTAPAANVRAAAARRPTAIGAGFVRLHPSRTLPRPAGARGGGAAPVGPSEGGHAAPPVVKNSVLRREENAKGPLNGQKIRFAKVWKRISGISPATCPVKPQLAVSAPRTDPPFSVFPPSQNGFFDQPTRGMPEPARVPRCRGAQTADAGRRGRRVVKKSVLSGQWRVSLVKKSVLSGKERPVCVRPRPRLGRTRRKTPVQQETTEMRIADGRTATPDETEFLTTQGAFSPDKTDFLTSPSADGGSLGPPPCAPADQLRARAGCSRTKPAPIARKRGRRRPRRTRGTRRGPNLAAKRFVEVS